VFVKARLAHQCVQIGLSPQRLVLLTRALSFIVMEHVKVRSSCNQLLFTLLTFYRLATYINCIRANFDHLDFFFALLRRVLCVHSRVTDADLASCCLHDLSDLRVRLGVVQPGLLHLVFVVNVQQLHADGLMLEVLLLDYLRSSYFVRF
jgi:hypothetical protein